MSDQSGRPKKSLAVSKEIQGRLRDLMKAKGWNRKQLASKCGVEQATVTGWFHARSPRIPSAQNLLSLARSSGYSLNWLLLGPPHPELIGDIVPLADLETALRSHVGSLLHQGHLAETDSWHLPPGGELIEAAVESARRYQTWLANEVGKKLSEMEPGASAPVTQEIETYRMRFALEKKGPSNKRISLRYAAYLRLLAYAVQNWRLVEWKTLMIEIEPKLQDESPRTLRAYLEVPPAELELITALRSAKAKDPKALEGTPFATMNLELREQELRQTVRHVENDLSLSPEEFEKEEDFWQKMLNAADSVDSDAD